MAERIEGLSIGLDLDTMKIDSGLTDLRSKLRTVNSEMRANMSAFDRSDRSIGKYETRLNGLNKKLEVQKEVTEKARRNYEKMVNEHGEGSAEAEKAARAYNRESAELNNLERYVEGVTEELKQMKEQQRIAESGWGRLGKTFEETGTKLTAAGDKMKSVGKSMSMYVTAPLVGMGAIAAKTGIDFDDSMRKVQAISGATGDDLTQLREKAKEMGATTRYSASESAEALNYMALAGWNTEEMIGGIDGVMSLAAASGEDLASVSDIVTDSLSAFGMEAKDSGHFADVLAQASANANTDVSGLGAAFQYVAPVAGSLGYTVEDTAQAIGLMSDNGIKGQKAGTALRTMMTNLAKPTKEMKGEMDNLGISLTDSEGNMKTFDEIMQDLRGSFDGLSEQQQASAAATIFGKEAMSGALAIINTTEDDYNNLSDAIGNSEGAAQRMADIMEGGLGGTLREIKSGIEGFAISIFEDMEPALKKGAEKVKGFVDWLNNLSPQLRVAAVVMAAFAAAIGPVLVAGGLLISLLGNVLTTLAPVMTSIAKAGGLLKWLRLGFVAFTGPVSITVGIIAALTAGFTLAYKKSDTFRGTVNKLKDAFLNAVSGIKEFLTTNESVLSMVDGIKNAFNTMRDLVSKAIGAIVGFFKEKISEMKSFWDSEGSSFLQAFSNVFGGIWKVVKPVLDAVLGAVKFTLPLIKGIFDLTFKAVLAVVKMVWENIKGVINGGLNVIMGLVKTFSGLFTGDFSKMWEGVKQIFSGAIEFVWNFVQLSFFGKLLKGVTSFIKLFSSPISKMWTGIRSVFSTVIKWIVDFVKNRFTSMSNTITTITTAIRNIISRIWNAILSFFKTVIKGIVDFVKQRFTNLKNNTTNIFTGVRDMAKRVWNKTKDNIVNPIKNGVNWAIKKFNGFKDSVTTTFKNIKDNVFGYVSDMITKVKNMPGNMKSKIVEGAHKVKDGMLAIGRKMVDGIASGVNGVIDAVKWVLKKFGIDKSWSWDPATSLNWYAKGTKGKHPGGAAVVGDGKNSNSGPELMRDPKGNFSLSPAKPTLIPNMPKGTQVWSATETREALTPQYAWGINFKDVAKALNLGGEAMQYSDSKTNRALGKAASGIGSGLDIYNDAPKALLNAGLKAMGVEIPSFPAAIGEMTKGGFNYVKDKAVGFIKKTQDDELESISGPASGGAKAWAPNIRKAAARMNESITSRHVNGIIAQINRESGGNEKIVQSPNVVDINTLSGNPARGLLQYIPQTFAAYKMPGHGNIYSGYDQLLAFFNNKTWRRDLPYGTRGWGPRGGRKFASGGLVKNSGLYELAEGGFPEWVIPTDPKRRTDAMKLLALAGKDIESGNKHPQQLPNVSGGGNSGNSEELSLLKQQVQLLTELVMSSRNIEQKPVLSEGDIQRSYNKMDSRQSTKHDIFAGKPGGAFA